MSVLDSCLPEKSWEKKKVEMKQEIVERKVEHQKATTGECQPAVGDLSGSCEQVRSCNRNWARTLLLLLALVAAAAVQYILPKRAFLQSEVLTHTQRYTATPIEMV